MPAMTAANSRLEGTCSKCGGSILAPSIDGAPRGTCRCQVSQVPATAVPLNPLCCCPKCGAFAICELTPEQRLAQPDDTTHVCHPLLGGCNHGFTDDRTLPVNHPQEDEMKAKSKKQTKAAKAAVVEAPNVEAVEVKAPEAPKAPKPIGFEPEGKVRAVKAGTKLAALIDELSREEGTTLDLLAAELSRTGSKVDVSAARSWLSYDLKRTGLGCRTEGDRLFLVGTPLPHREATPPKAAPEGTIQKVETVPKLKKVAMTAKRSKKALAASA